MCTAALEHRDEIMKSVRALRAEKDRMFTLLNDEVSRPIHLMSILSTSLASCDQTALP